MAKRCRDRLGLSRCERPEGHDGMHCRGEHVWGFREVPEPEWLRRMRAYGLPAKDLTGAL